MRNFASIEELRRELQLAYQSQLLSHEQATKAFFHKVAELCEQAVAFDALSLSKALSSMSESDTISIFGPGAYALDNPKVPEKKGDLNGSRVYSLDNPKVPENGGDLNSSPLRSGQMREPTNSVEQISVEDSKSAWLNGRDEVLDLLTTEGGIQSNLENLRKLSPTSASRSGGPPPPKSPPPELRRTISKRSHNLKSIGTLEFFGDNGDLLHPPSTLDHILGQRYRGFKQSLTSKFCNCSPITGFFPDLVTSSAFKLLSASVIVCNFIFIIAQSDYRVDNLGQSETSFMKTVGYLFTGFYTLEICALLFVQRRDFFIGRESGWNMFDSVIVIVALFEMMMEIISGHQAKTSFLRVLRFFKVSRVLRMFSALRMVKEIRIMVDALSGCFTLFFFCVGMLAIFLSIFAIFFVQGVGEFLENHKEEISPAEVEKLLENFGSVSDAMLSLFMACTGGNDWVEFHSSIKLIGKAYDYLFLLFIVSTFMAFFNVVTSVFCEKAMSLATPTLDELCVKRRHDEYEAAENLVTFLKHGLKDDGSHMVNADSFEQFVTNPDVEVFFKVRGTNVASAHQVFDLLCEAYDTDQVDQATFVSALVKLDGFAANVDAHCILTRLSKCMSSIQSLHSDVKVLQKGQWPYIHEVPEISC